MDTRVGKDAIFENTLLSDRRSIREGISFLLLRSLMTGRMLAGTDVTRTISVFLCGVGDRIGIEGAHSRVFFKGSCRRPFCSMLSCETTRFMKDFCAESLDERPADAS